MCKSKKHATSVKYTVSDRRAGKVTSCGNQDTPVADTSGEYMTARKISVGVVGAGYIANFAHLPPLSRLHEANLTAICDQDIIRAQKVAKQFSIPKVYSNLEEMLSNERLDLVDICLPPQKHKDALLKALEHGLNCLVEKPLTVTTADADTVISTARENKVNVYVIHNYSVVPAVLKAKTMVAKGVIGEVTGVHINQFVLAHERYFEPNHWCHSLPGEYFSDLAPHLAMLLVEFLGPVNKVETIVAKVSSNSPLRLDELRIIAQTPKALGTIACSLNCPSFIFTMDIVGTQGAIHLSGDYQAVVYCRPVGHYMSAWARGLVGVRDILTRTAALARTSAGVLVGKYAPLTMGHSYLIQRCLWALQGKGNYPIDTSKTREAVRLLEMAFQEIKGL